MSVYRISYRYAKSLFQLALEKNSLKKLADDAVLVYSTLDKSKQLRTVLKSPVVKPKDKKELLQKLFVGKVTDDTSLFLDFIVDKNREDILHEIMNEFLKLSDQHEGIIRPQITSAGDITDALKEEIDSKLEKRTNKKVKSRYSVDKKLIGGFVVKVDDTVIDASVSRQLELLRKKLLEDISISNN